jgi:hypothetical protein
MAPRGRPPKAKTDAKAKATAVAVAATPEPEVREMNLEQQAEKRTEIMKQMMDNQWYERQWDSQFAMHVIRERGFKCPPHSIQRGQTVSKAVTINHWSPHAAAERLYYQVSLSNRGWMIYEQFGIDYLTQPTCEWARFQKWCKNNFKCINIRFAKDEISVQEYVQQLGKAYRTLNGFQSTYWDKLRQDRIELEYQKWLSTVRQSVREEEIPEDTVWDVEDDRVVRLHPDNSSIGIIKRIMKEQCHVPEDAASHTQEWIARRVESSKLIFGLSPEHRGQAPTPKTPSASENSETEAGSPKSNDDGGDATENELEEANIVPSTNIRAGRLQLAKPNAQNKRFKDKRLPPLRNKGLWVLRWDEMTPAQKAKMRELHFGKNEEYHRPPKWGSAPRDTPALGRDLDNSGDAKPADQNDALTSHHGQDGTGSNPGNGPKSSGESELTDQTETTSSQQAQHDTAAAQSAKSGQAMEKSASSGPNAPIMLPANGNGDDDGSTPPNQGNSTPSKGECDEQGSMGRPPAIPSQDPPAKRGRGRLRKFRAAETQAAQSDPSQSSQPRQPPAQSNPVREDTLMKVPITPPRQAAALSPRRPRLGGFSDAPESFGLRQRPGYAPPDGTWNSDAGVNVEPTMNARLGTVVRPPWTPRATYAESGDPGYGDSGRGNLGNNSGAGGSGPSSGNPRPGNGGPNNPGPDNSGLGPNTSPPSNLNGLQIQRPSLRPRPPTVNAWQAEALRASAARRASQTPGPSGNGFTPVNEPASQTRSSPTVQRTTFDNVSSTQGQPSGTPSAHPTATSGTTSRPRANHPDARGILIRDTNGSYAPAPQPTRRRGTSPTEHGFRPRPPPPPNFSHMNQHMSPPEHFGNPAPRPRPQSSFNPATQGHGVPMTPQKSHPGYNSMPQYPQQQGQVSRGMGSQMQHGNMAQRQVQNPAGQGFSDYHQSPSMMQQGISMNYTNAFANNGNGAAQTSSSWPGRSSSSSMTGNQLDWYDGSTNPLNFEPSRFNQQSSMNGNGMVQSSANMHNTMNVYGMVHPSPDIQSSMNGYLPQSYPSQQYGMTLSPNHYHPGSFAVGETQRRVEELRHERQRMRQQRPQSGNRQMLQDQNRHDSLGRPANTPQNNNQSIGILGVSRIPRPASAIPDGVQPNGALGGHVQNGPRSQPGFPASNNRQPDGASVGQSTSININQAQHGVRPRAPTNGQPNGEKGGRGRPKKSPPQQAQTGSQTQAQVSAPTPAQTQPQSSQSTQTWGRDRSVYLGEPVDTANGPLTFPPLHHIRSPPRGPRSDTGNLQSMQPVEQNHQHLSLEDLREQSAQLAVANQLGHPVQPAEPSTQPQPWQRQQNPGNDWNNLNDLSFSIPPDDQEDMLVQQHVPIVLGPQARQQAQLPENGYADDMGFEDLFDFNFDDPAIE